MVDEAAHKAAGGLPVVRVAQALIKAPIDDVALCWWQAGRRKVGVRWLQTCAHSSELAMDIDMSFCLVQSLFECQVETSVDKQRGGPVSLGA